MGDAQKVRDLTDDQLMDVIVNFHKYGYPETIREAAFRELKKRKIPQAEIDRIAEKYVVQKRDEQYEHATLLELYRRYVRCSLVVLAGYFFTVLLSLAYAVLREPSLRSVLPFLLLGTAGVMIGFAVAAIGQNLRFRAVADRADTNRFLVALVYYILVFSFAPLIVTYNIVYMKRVLRRTAG